MKALLITSCILFSLNVFSEDMKHHKEMEKKMDNMSFEDAKKMHLDMLDKKTKMIEDEKICLNDAKDKEAIRTCMKDMHKEMMDKK
jgi:hypothetical protein